MSDEPVAARPFDGFAVEAAAFLEALEVTPPDALTGCAQWRAHEVAAHLGAGAVEIALNLEAYGEGRPVPATRGFEERETPYRSMEDAELRSELPHCLRVSHKVQSQLPTPVPGSQRRGGRCRRQNGLASTPAGVPVLIGVVELFAGAREPP